MAEHNTDALLREVTRLYEQAQRESLACCDSTTHTECLVITNLGRSEPMTPLMLGEKLGLEKSWVSRVVDRLVQEGLVMKSPNEQDKRSVLLSLTPAGRERFHQLNQTLNDHADRLMSHLSDDQQQMIQHALTLLRDALRVEIAGAAVIPLDAIALNNP